MERDEIETYLLQAAALQELDLSPAQLERVATVFIRSAELAELVMSFPLDETVEGAVVFVPQTRADPGSDEQDQRSAAC